MSTVELPDELKTVRFTPVEMNIIRLLSDGEPHTKDELRECLYDNLGADRNIQFHISRLRGKVDPLGFLISIRFKGRLPQYILSRSL